MSSSTWGGGVGWMGPPVLMVSFGCVALSYAHHTSNPLAIHEVTKTAMGLAHCILMQHGGPWRWYSKPIGHHQWCAYSMLGDTTSSYIKFGHPRPHATYFKIAKKPATLIFKTRSFRGISKFIGGKTIVLISISIC